MQFYESRKLVGFDTQKSVVVEDCDFIRVKIKNSELHRYKGSSLDLENIFVNKDGFVEGKILEFRCDGKGHNIELVDELYRSGWVSLSHVENMELLTKGNDLEW